MKSVFWYFVYVIPITMRYCFGIGRFVKGATQEQFSFRHFESHHAAQTSVANRMQN